MARSSQKAIVALAFLAGVLSLVAAAIGYYKTGQLNATPLAGGIFMILIGVSGMMRLRKL